MNAKAIAIGVKVASYVEKHGAFPASITLDNVKYNYGTFNAILADGIVNSKPTLKNKTYNNAPSPTGDKINKTLTKNEYIKLAKDIVSFYKKGRCPNYALYQKYKISPQVFGYDFAKIARFYGINARLPNTCKFNSGIIKKNTASPIQSNDSVFKYFVKVFGAVKTIDEALGKVKDRGYGHYLDDFLSNKQTIDNLKNGGQKPNCTDACHVFWHIAKALGYDVIVEHVRCQSSGEGHVRLKLRHAKHTGGNWIRRDPACVVSANGKALTEIWCSNGKLLATNPSWFMVNVNR